MGEVDTFKDTAMMRGNAIVTDFLNLFAGRYGEHRQAVLDASRQLGESIGTLVAIAKKIEEEQKDD